ncbi:MAG: hypothetical protein IJV06_00290 [Bacteroidaceae bacterium]|nr:hypothetical protein [Bacteroidaceae bacterium]MBQ9639994.1 hypothetical protein [Bacteroidaceae bacterium]
MSTALLANLRERKQQPFTMAEINARIDEAERQIASGLSQNSEDMFRELEEESVENVRGF